MVEERNRSGGLTTPTPAGRKSRPDFSSRLIAASGLARPGQDLAEAVLVGEPDHLVQARAPEVGVDQDHLEAGARRLPRERGGDRRLAFERHRRGHQDGLRRVLAVGQEQARADALQRLGVGRVGLLQDVVLGRDALGLAPAEVRHERERPDPERGLDLVGAAEAVVRIPALDQEHQEHPQHQRAGERDQREQRGLGVRRGGRRVGRRQDPGVRFRQPLLLDDLPEAHQEGLEQLAIGLGAHASGRAARPRRGRPGPHRPAAGPCCWSAPARAPAPPRPRWRGPGRCAAPRPASCRGRSGSRPGC